MKLKSVLIILTTVSFFSGCNYSTSKENAAEQNKNIVLKTEDLSYTKINEQILKPKCLSCHSGREEPNLSTYKDVVAYKTEIYTESVNSDDMPKNNNKLTAAQKQNLKSWLDAGAPEFGSNPDEPQNPPPVVTNPPVNTLDRPVLWATVKTKIFNKSCTSCHFAGNKEGLSSYEDYEQTKATIATIFYTVSIIPVMPPAPVDLPEGAINPNQLSREDKDLLSAWVNDGMLK
jgi:uncharacterized membrane protein